MPALRLAEVQHLQRARLGGIAADEALGLERRQVGVDRRRRRQADRLPDLAHAGRIAAAVDLRAHEVKDLLLALGEFALVGHRRPLGIEHLYEDSVAARDAEAQTCVRFLACTSNICSVYLRTNTCSYGGRMMSDPAGKMGSTGSTPQQGETQMYAHTSTQTGHRPHGRAAAPPLAARRELAPVAARAAVSRRLGSPRPDRHRRPPGRRARR